MGLRSIRLPGSMADSHKIQLIVQHAGQAVIPLIAFPYSRWRYLLEEEEEEEEEEEWW